MREILFKAKRKDNGEWVFGDLSHHKTGKVFIKAINGSATSSFEVDPETVSEYIGLLDKNGNKIFENDIVGLYSDYREEYDYGVVVYGDFNCSCCSGVYGWYFEGEDIRDYERYEVRGNIFGNPELLGGDSK